MSENARTSGSGKDVGSGAIPVREGHIKHYKPRERAGLRYDSGTEQMVILKDGFLADYLQSLDSMLAPYPFGGWEDWKNLTGEINQEMLDRIIGAHGRIDGLAMVEGQEEEKDLVEALKKMQTSSDTAVEEEGGVLRFTQFNLKRSWRSGAVGEEVTKWSRDKSWLLSHVIERTGGRLPAFNHHVHGN